MEQSRAELLFEISEAFDNNVLEPLIEEILFLENRLKELKELPFLKIDKSNPTRQKATPAARQYKELLQQYQNCLKLLLVATGKTEHTEDTPLRNWVENVRKKMESR